MSFDKIAVIGAGAWGVALANVITRAGRCVTLAARNAQSAAAIGERRESPRLLASSSTTRCGSRPRAPMPHAMMRSCWRCRRSICAQRSRRSQPTLTRGTPVIACAKGIERGTHKFMTDVIAECAPSALPAILSGPSFALTWHVACHGRDARGIG